MRSGAICSLSARSSSTCRCHCFDRLASEVPCSWILLPWDLWIERAGGRSIWVRKASSLQTTWRSGPRRAFRFSGIPRSVRSNSISRSRLNTNRMTICSNSGSQRGHHSREYFPMRLTKLALATAVAAVALGSAPGAFAQRNTAASVLVVNYQRVVAESALGRDMSTKLQGVGSQIQQQDQAMQSEGQAIEAEDQRLA